MDSTTTLPPKSKRRASCRINDAGTALTSGQPIRRLAGRTTCALSAVSDARVEAARLWVRSESGKAQTKQDFISDAIDMAVRSLLAANPDFKLPPACAF